MLSLKLKMKNTLISLFIPFICFGQRIDLQPKVAKGRIVEHTYFHLSYVEEHEQSEWVHYRLDSIMLKGKERRKDYTFRVDTKDSITSSSTNYNYKKYKYERGHLAPFADMKIDSRSASESFLMSNISPQLREFNGGEWKKLEEHVRSIAKENEIYVTTGGVLSPDLISIGIKNKVSVPKLFYKIIYDPDNEKMIAYLMPNKKIESFKNYQVTVDLIENLTGIDFYPQLEDEKEEKLESKL
tara:strand:- start:143 stop:865 length:723 start_codon:yes stop_codon:yes gene_type:complete